MGYIQTKQQWPCRKLWSQFICTSTTTNLASLSATESGKMMNQREREETWGPIGKDLYI